jgi:hypothetical protein
MRWDKKWSKFKVDTKRCTCLKCDHSQECPFAFDLYNVDGDCLVEK